jgi:hypothetical protein
MSPRRHAAADNVRPELTQIAVFIPVTFVDGAEAEALATRESSV